MNRSQERGSWCDGKERSNCFARDTDIPSGPGAPNRQTFLQGRGVGYLLA